MPDPIVGLTVLMRCGEDPTEILSEATITSVWEDGRVNLELANGRRKEGVPYSEGALQPYSWTYVI